MSFLQASPLNLNLEGSSSPYPSVLTVNGTDFVGVPLQNTYVGLQAGNIAANLGGNYNTAIGYQSGAAITSSNYSTYMGRQAGQSSDADFNTCIGYLAGQGVFGAQNTALGAETLSGFGITFNGTFNTAIGRAAGANYQTTESNNALFNSPGVTGESNVLRLGNPGAGAGQQSKAFIAGVYGVTTTSATTSAVLVSDGHQLGTIASSIRFKKDVADMGETSSAMMQLRPVTFKYKSHTDDVLQYGLIAEEVQQVMPGIVNLDQEGNPFTVRYHDLVPMLLNELQKLAARVTELEAK
jgi:hypothetical protein